MEEIILKEAIAAVKSLLQSWNTARKVNKLSISSEGAEEALAHHLKFVENWSRQISLRDLPRSRSLEEIFVNLRLSDSAGKANAGSVEPRHILESGLNTILLGHVGAGKTTLVKHLCQHLLHEASANTDSFSFPIVVLLRDLRPEESLSEYLLNMLRMKLAISNDEVDRVPPKKIDADERERVLARYLDTSRAILFLDGLDEMAPESRRRAQREISHLANVLCSAKFVLTCRLGILEVAIDNSEFLHICPLDARQVRDFVGQWLGSETEAKNFLSAIYRTPYHDTINRPLILVHLCMVHQWYGELPEQPVLIYQKVVQLLLEQWDRQRDLQRVSRYGRFGPERKQQFLGALAYKLSTSYRGGSRYHEAEIRTAYRVLHSSFALPLEELDQVIAEIESHTGLFASAGPGQFEFSHKSLQEYLCADHISRLPDLKKHISDIIRLPEECAIATVISASPNEFFEFLSFGFVCGEGLKGIFGRQILGFWNPYLTRLRLEGATFQETPTLGFALLFVASLAWGRWGESEIEVYLADGGERVIRLIDKFLEIPAVHNSVRHASAAFCVVSTGSEYADCHLLSGGGSVPQNAPKRLFLHKGLVVGPSWCGTI
jgi:energy-coupling factor transporter ATP-binding protein EcfA2